MNAVCCDNPRRDLVLAAPGLNAIDYLEVVDRELIGTPDAAQRQRVLLLHFLKPLGPGQFAAVNVAISGGERIRGVHVTDAKPGPTLNDPSDPIDTLVAKLVDVANVLVVYLDREGDYSTYTLSLTTSALDPTPPPGIDTELAAIDFSFKIDCPSDFDCKPVHDCCPPTPPAPDIDYLAKDYPGFRRLMLDRMLQLAPAWRETSEADTGIALVELLAYVGDQLSYRQDAIATEAYLETVRRRISLRRLSVLVDYAMHDGCNARAWLHLHAVPTSCTLPLRAVQFLTRLAGFPSGIETASQALRDAMLLAPTVFEPVLDPRFAPDFEQPLYAKHNVMSFYTWSGRRCCLPRGSTSATLAGHFPDLHPGDVLLIEEVLGPLTGVAGDLDPTHRQVVRLTQVSLQQDDLTHDDITAIAWNSADALTFAACLSGTTDDAHGAQYLSDISVARGNVILIDHGQTLPPETLPLVRAPSLFALAGCAGDRCDPAAPTPIPVRYRPVLAQAPLTQVGTVLASAGAGQLPNRMPFDPTAAAATALVWQLDDVRPAIALDDTTSAVPQGWTAQRSLLESGAEATDFVVEIDDRGTGALRFGDDEHGQRPNAGTKFQATYRIGNGAAGNVGAETVVHIVAALSDLANIDSVRNPFAASGGIDAESAASVRRNAPEAFRTQERAVTPADYAAVTERHAGVQRAAATLRWTGSWYTPFITVDAIAGVDVDALKQDLLPFVDRYRMAGHDLEFKDPAFVSLAIELHVCVADDYFRSDVKSALLEALSSNLLPGGRKGFFHADNFSFGQTVYLSPLYAAVHAVPGVASASVVAFARQSDPKDPAPLLNGFLTLGATEIARLDNDPNFPEHGVLTLDVRGGK